MFCELSESMKRLALFSLLLGVFLSGPLHGGTEMVVVLDRSALYEGETLLYQIQLQSDKPIEDGLTPDLSAFSDFQVVSRPKQTQHSGQSSFTLTVNGEIVQNTRTTTPYSVTFTYLLTPRRAGSLTVPAPKVLIDGTALRPKTVRIGQRPRSGGDGSIPITVQPPDQQDDVRLEITVNKKRVYPLQPITVTLTVHIKELPGRFERTNPLSHLRNSPFLWIPWGIDGALPRGLQPTQSDATWLAGFPLRGRQRGFTINERNDDFGFSLFSSFTREYSPIPTQVQRPDDDGKEQIYWEYQFPRTFMPQELGTLTFGPASVKGAFAVADSTSEAHLRPIYALAPSMEVQVVDVPKENRPTEYIGAFGSFRWDVDLQPRKANVGDPLTLTLSLHGRGSTTNATPPILAEIPEIAENFRVYPPREEVRGESCVFTYTVRPTTPGNVVFPSIPIAVFDTEAEEFVFLDSEPLTVDVSATEVLAIVSPSIPMFGGELERSPDGLFANVTAPRGVVDQSVDIVRWSGTMASLLIVYGVLAGSLFVWKRRNADPVRRRRNSALGRAKRRLVQIKTADTNLLQGILIGYVADLTDGVEHGMTPKDVCVRLMDLGVSDQRVAEVRGVLETLDGARFGGPGLRSFDDIAGRVRLLLDEISATVGHGSKT